MELTRSAQILRKELKKDGIDVSHTRLLDMLARANGHADFKSTKLKKYDINFGGQIVFEEDNYTDPWNIEIEATSEDDAHSMAENLLDNCSVFLVGHNSPITGIEGADWFIGLDEISVKKAIHVCSVIELPSSGVNE